MSIQKAIDVAGSQEKLSMLSGLSQGTISKYVRGYKITAESALRIEQSIDKKVMRHELCPEVFIGYVPNETL
jgi:DNA-binding transcriptional regulator YdaS (Cro superfamily)